MDEKKVEEIIRANPDKTYDQIAKEIRNKTGIIISEDSVRRRYKKYLGSKPKTLKKGTVLSDEEIHATIEQERAELSQTAEITNLKKKVKALYGALDARDQQISAILEIKKPVETFTIKPQEKFDVSEATAVMIASDWHVEEEVDSSKVLGRNKYNLDIARERAELFFKRGLRLIKKEQQDVKINTLILGLLGDFISGNIHEELLATCQLPPVEAMLYARQLIQSGIQFLLENSELNLIVVCHSGNHGRITKQVHISNENGNSLEYAMYADLANVFANEKRVTFIVSKGYQTYLDVYDTVLRLHHGHSIKYGGGVGGITIPVNKALASWDRARQSTYDVFGHFHQYFPAPRFVANGSMIGYNAYALSIKAEYEPPQQAFFLIDKKRGKTIQAPILFI